LCAQCEGPPSTGTSAVLFGVFSAVLLAPPCVRCMPSQHPPSDTSVEYAEHLMVCGRAPVGPGRPPSARPSIVTDPVTAQDAATVGNPTLPGTPTPSGPGGPQLSLPAPLPEGLLGSPVARTPPRVLPPLRSGANTPSPGLATPSPGALAAAAGAMAAEGLVATPTSATGTRVLSYPMSRSLLSTCPDEYHLCRCHVRLWVWLLLCFRDPPSLALTCCVGWGMRCVRWGRGERGKGEVLWSSSACTCMWSCVRGACALLGPHLRVPWAGWSGVAGPPGLPLSSSHPQRRRTQGNAAACAAAGGPGPTGGPG
jgi:hypothetical protein